MSYAANTLATFANVLGAMDNLIGKAENSGVENLLEKKLAPDMFAAALQIRMVTFQVLNALDRLTSKEHKIPGDDPADFVAAKEMIATARQAVKDTSYADFVGPDADIEFDIPNGMEFALSAEEYVRDWVMAQIYFHATTFYAILRANGVAIGKADFVGHMMHHIKR